MKQNQKREEKLWRSIISECARKYKSIVRSINYILRLLKALNAISIELTFIYVYKH
jgi:hypothetical protein